jgi:hypothetical protein
MSDFQLITGGGDGSLVVGRHVDCASVIVMAGEGDNWRVVNL